MGVVRAKGRGASLPNWVIWAVKAGIKPIWIRGELEGVGAGIRA